MRRTASEVIRELEMRVARLEKEAIDPWETSKWIGLEEPDGVEEGYGVDRRAPSTGSKENLVLLQILEDAGISADIERGSVKAYMRPRLVYRTLLKAVKGVKIYREGGYVEMIIPHPSLVRMKADVWLFKEGSDHAIFSLIV